MARARVRWTSVQLRENAVLWGRPRCDVATFCVGAQAQSCRWRRGPDGLRENGMSGTPAARGGRKLFRCADERLWRSRLCARAGRRISSIATNEEYERFPAWRELDRVERRCDHGLDPAGGGGGSQAHQHDSDRLRHRVRSGQKRARRQPGAPGRNLTGMSNVTDDLTAKRVHMFREAVPGLKRLGVMFNPEGGPAQLFEQYEDRRRRTGDRKPAA